MKPFVLYFIDDADALHRLDGPAVIRYTEEGVKFCEEYFFHGVWHRDDGPAIIRYYENGDVRSEEYMIHGQTHRDTDPAVIRYFRHGSPQRSWYQNEKLHNEFGPAIIHSNGDKFFFINGVRVDSI